MQKLAISKQIMDKHDGIPNSGICNPAVNINENSLFSSPNPNYNIPNIKNDHMEKTFNEESVMNSNLPDEIKKLMIENPIQKPDQQTNNLSNDIIRSHNHKTNQGKEVTNNTVSNTSVTPDLKESIRNIVRDTVRDTIVEVMKEELSNKIILSEDGKNVKDKLTFKVGSHLFEGYVTKIKKIK